ncbi:MAG TPA: extracellular solute-binding protein, partial [Rhodopila sp.]|nr:extracellular solute-binding protein [Rhodopila sp.]
MPLSRRHMLQAAAAGASAPLLDWARAWAADQPFTPEKGASLQLLRGATFLPAEGETTAANVAAFTAATGVEVRIENITQDDLPAKSALAAQVGSGPDIIWTQNTTAHLIADKLVDVSDVAKYLGGKYGPWYQVCIDHGTQDGAQGRHWICIPIFVVGSLLNYRISWMQQAGFGTFPATTDGLLKLCQGLRKIGHPAGFSFGHAVNDANNFNYWLLWAFGGRVTDDAGHPAIDSPQTLAALDYAAELYPTLIPGVLSWMDINNNRAFLAGECSLTNNGISIYTQAKKTAPEIAADMDHAAMPIGPIGVPTAQNRVDPMVIFKYTRYPKAAKALVTFLMEAPQYPKLITNSAGFTTQALKGYADNPVWTSDPKIAPFGKAAEDT